MDDNSRNMTIPKGGGDSQNETENTTSKEEGKGESEKKEKTPITQEEADFIDKVFFEEDDQVRLRDGKTYRIPPLGLKDARKLMKKLNTIDTAIIITNLMPDDGEDDDKYNELLDVLSMAFKGYYKHVDIEYLAEYVDLVSAKQIIDSMIGINGLKKLL